MKKAYICLVLFVLFQVSFQYCHYSYQPNNLQNGDCLCTSGLYSNSGNCQICPNNTTNVGSSTSVSDCKQCSSNSYFLSQAATVSTSSVCLLCPNNSQVKNNSPPQTDPQDVSACNQCQQGYYLQTPAVPPQKGNPGQAAVCVKCPNNTYAMDSSGSLCDTCNQEFYISQKATNSQPAICSPCPNNSINNYTPNSKVQYNANDCVSCQLGYYNTQPLGKKPLCVQCPPNTSTLFTGANQIYQCTCTKNYYMTVASTFTTGATCFPCPNGSGKYLTLSIVGDQSLCDICQDGYYLITPYKDPEIGNPGKAAQCEICPNNSSSDPGVSTSVSSCYKCQLNFYMQKASTISTSAICQPCPNNSATLNPVTQQGDATQCSICVSGYYMTKAFQAGQTASCQKCPPESYSIQGINTACYCYDQYASWSSNTNSCQCIQGYNGNPATSAGAQGCIACPAGKGYQSGSCVDCQAGQFIDLTSGKCSPCPAGTFSNGQANANCTQCSPGQYANGTGNTVCSNCGTGSTNTDDFTGCKCYDSNAVAWSADKNQCYCAANFYGDASQATSASKTQCINCPNNTTSKIGAAKTQKDCQNSSSSSSSQNNQQNGQYTYSSIIQISILALVLLI